MIVVSNSSPLIAGADIGIESILEALFGEVIIPPAVRQEYLPVALNRRGSPNVP